MTNMYRIMTGSFSVEKIVAGDIDRDDARLAGIEFSAEWASTDPSLPGGQLVMAAPDWSGVPMDGEGDPVDFPLGTEITLGEINLPAIPGVAWGDDVEWSIGDEGIDASFTIVDEDSDSGPSAAVTLTNFAELHEGSFSIAKFVHSITPTDSTDARFTVSYRSPGENPVYEGTLTVTNDDEVFSDAFPAGTELVLEEILPDALPGTVGWQAPQFVDLEGNVLKAPVLITIGDGTDVRVELINTTVEPENPTKPNEPTKPGLPTTGADSGVLVAWTAVALLLILGGAVSVLVARRRG